MSRTIIVSDLHVDTWSDRRIGNTGKSKKEHFFTLLDWCEQVGIREFVIDGDLMDLPPYVGQCAFPAGPCIARDVVERLISLSARVPVTYVFGNHDIGISGFRSMGTDSISILRNLNFCYTNYLIDDYLHSTILIEHGHFCDPAFPLYLRDLANRTYIESKLDKFDWLMHRNKSPDTPNRPSPGILPPVDVEAGRNAYHAAKQDQQPLKASLVSRIGEWLWEHGRTAIAKPTMERWWKSAIGQMRTYADRAESAGGTTKPVIYQIYGHTHRADPRDPVPIGRGSMGIYINAGTWTEEVDQGWYLDVDSDGRVWLQDWINEPEELRRL